MNRKEFLEIMAGIESLYENFNVMNNDFALEVWYDLLKDIPTQVMGIVIKKHLATSPFAPKICDIRQLVTEVTTEPSKDPAEAWGEVTKAIQRYGSYNEATALESMSETTRKVVIAMNYRELCLSENQMADRAHFIKLYEQHSNRQKRDKALPLGLQSEIKQLTTELADKMALLPGGKEHE